MYHRKSLTNVKWQDINNCGGFYDQMSSDSEANKSSEFNLTFTHPEAVLSDERFEIRIGGLPERECIKVTAAMEDEKGDKWQSWAEYNLNKPSLVLDEQSPTNGMWLEPDTMNLIQTMEPVGNLSRPYIPPSETVLRLEVSVNQEPLGSSKITWHFCDPGIQSFETPDEFGGTLFSPPDNQKVPGVILLHGSDGRPLEETAKLLASNGFAALALKYFNSLGQDHPKLPNGMIEIPVEYVDRAVEWVLNHDVVSSSTVGIFGSSKGGELGLLTASRNDNISVVVCKNGSALVWEGLVYHVNHPGSTWTIDDEPVPFVPWKDDIQWEDMRERFDYRTLYKNSYEQASAKEINEATIPVEQIRGPILFITGKDDQFWPLHRINQHAVDRLEENDRPYERILFERAGHVILPPYRPTVNRYEGLWVFGGSPLAYRKADEVSWNRSLEMFNLIE